MKFFQFKNQANANSIFFYDSSKEKINTESIFEIVAEGENLRVKNDHVNCLFKHLTFEEFDAIYNKFHKSLHLDFSPINVGNKSYSLSEKEQHYLIQNIITHWIYFYSINGLKIEVKKSDFEHPYMIDQLLFILDKKYGVDTNESLKLGARILRQKEDSYKLKVHGRRKYYEK